MNGQIDPPLPTAERQFESLRANSRASMLLLGLALSIGMAGLLFGPAWAQRLFRSVELTEWAGVTAVAAAFATSILIHETGHFIAALAMNFQVFSVSLGPVRARHVHSKWQFELNTTNLLWASVSAAPRDMGGWRRRLLVVVAAGPAATLITGIVALFAFGQQQGGSWSFSYLGALAQFSTFVFLLGLVPNGRGVKKRNDAQLLYTLCENAADARQILLYYQVKQMEIADVSPRDYPEQMIRELARCKGRVDSMLFCAQTVAKWAGERGDSATAREWDSRCAQLRAICESGAPVLARGTALVLKRI